jgi:hypothetical protein
MSHETWFHRRLAQLMPMPAPAETIPSLNNNPNAQVLETPRTGPGRGDAVYHWEWETESLDVALADHGGPATAACPGMTGDYPPSPACLAFTIAWARSATCSLPKILEM